MNEQLKDIHKRYNLIFDEQDKLPLKRGVKDYSDIETKISNMANKLSKELIVYKSNIKDKSCLIEIGNILSGCHELMINPYNRIGSRINIE